MPLLYDGVEPEVLPYGLFRLRGLPVGPDGWAHAAEALVAVLGGEPRPVDEPPDVCVGGIVARRGPLTGRGSPPSTATRASAAWPSRRAPRARPPAGEMSGQHLGLDAVAQQRHDTAAALAHAVHLAVDLFGAYQLSPRRHALVTGTAISGAAQGVVSWSHPDVAGLHFVVVEPRTTARGGDSSGELPGQGRSGPA
ncbi:MAG: hypothetical protein R3F65_30875 [bacterium]